MRHFPKSITKRFPNFIYNDLEASQEINNLFVFIGLFIAGALTGKELIPYEFFGIVDIALACVCIFSAYLNNIKAVLFAVPYMCYLEVFIRNEVLFIPYLFVPYTLILTLVLLLMRRNELMRFHSKAVWLIVLYGVIELVDVFRASNIDVTRAIASNTVLLVLVSLWSSSHFFTPKCINFFLENVKRACIFIIGYCLTGGLFNGNFKFDAISNSAVINGLAPNQISAYFGFVAMLSLFTILNDKGIKFWINTFLFTWCVILMALSFSRGGIYFIAIICTLYFMFHWRTKKILYIMAFIIPMAAGMVYFTINFTHGAIEERYAMEGASGREELLVSGLKLFYANPVLGVGTGNFNDAVAEADFYETESGAHDEFIRTLAEHGLAGIFTYWAFFVAVFVGIITRRGIKKEYAIYFFALFCLITIHNGMKISLQPFILAVALGTPNYFRNKQQENPVEKFVHAA